MTNWHCEKSKVLICKLVIQVTHPFQTYPAVEYDFIPNRATVSTADLVHIQWTGSNTHNNQPNGGDGQTGDAGEGQGGELKC